MVAIKIPQLIDLAIGFPETGQVNFSALHCLLICMAEKLDLTEVTIDYDEIDNEKYSKWQRQSRLIGGLNPEEAGNESEKNKDQDEISLIQIAFEEEQQLDEYEMMEEEMAEEAVEVPNEPQQSVARSSDLLEAAVEKDTKSQALEVAKTRNSDLMEQTVAETNQQMIAMASADNKTIVPSDLLAGASVLKQQLELVVDQILLLTFLMLSKKPDLEQLQQLHVMARTLNDLKRQSLDLEGLNHMTKPMASVLSLNWMSSNLKLNQEDATNRVSFTTDDFVRSADDILEGHVCYSPSKLLDQLMTLKSELCLLVNKVNEISAHLLREESHQVLSLVQEAHKQIRDLKLANVDLKDSHSRLEQKVSINHNNGENLKRDLEDMMEAKVDKTYFDLQMTNKVDYQQLQRQASLDQMLELQCRSDKKFAEIFQRFSDNEKRLLDVVENLKATLGPPAVQEVLAQFKDTMYNEIQQLHDLLKKYIESTNDDCAAAGGRVKVMQDLVCLSCNTNCVMPAREKAKVGKLRSAHASSSISPLVTYELGSIRKSGLMGYYRKDEFPHSPNAWLAQQSPTANTVKRSPGRQAGGQHTISSAKERYQKIKSNRK